MALLLLAPRARSRESAPLDWEVSSALLAARLLVERGWVQDTFLVVRNGNGRTRPLGPFELGWYGPRDVVGGCLLGAVAYGAWTNAGGPDRVTQRAAVDRTWSVWAQALGVAVPAWLDHGPDARGRRSADLARWNDVRGRSRDEVTDLLSRAARLD